MTVCFEQKNSGSRTRGGGGGVLRYIFLSWLLYL